MSEFPWYKRNPSDFLQGVVGMTAIEIGIYAVILDLLYDGRQPIKDDPPVLARRCGCTTRRFNMVRDRLLAMPGKLIRRGPDLSNLRFEREIGLKFALCSIEKPEDNRGDNRGDNPREKRTPPNRANGLGEKRPKNAGRDSRARASEARSKKQEPESLAGEDASKISKICSVIGVRLEGDLSRINWPRQLIELEQAGLDFEHHILPAITHMKERGADLSTIKALRYFKRPAEELKAAQLIDGQTDAAEARKIEDVDAASIPREKWIEAFRVVLGIGAWVESELGPSPFRPGCKAPADVIKAAGDKWKEQGEHPLRGFTKGGTYPTDWKTGIATFPGPVPFHKPKGSKAS